MPRKTEVWECEYCGEWFDSKGVTLHHEEQCEENPDNKSESEE